jgi:actin related protein 2/3 complex subunit 1A/1B
MASVAGTISMQDNQLVFAQSITSHAWNGDFSKIAFSPNSSTIQIYKSNGSDWEVEDVLQEHDQTVTSISWAPKSNTLLSCSHDRNAYVWSLQDGQWKPTLVILRINRAATQVKWSPNEDKFAVSSGAKCVSICYYEEDNDWWVSKHIKKHDSTVTSVDWHPGNVLIATGSCDSKVRVFSAFIKGIDKRPENTPYGKRLPFGQDPLCEYDAGGWVQAVRWAPSGNQLAFVAQNSTLTVVDVTNGAPGEIQVIKFSDLPLMDLCWVGETKIVGVGHGCKPLLFENQGGTWSYVRSLDENKSTANEKRSAFSVFQNKVNLGQDQKAKTLETKQKNCITCIQQGPGGQLSTSSLDGTVCLWNPN